jgi:hypothetical protein
MAHNALTPLLLIAAAHPLWKPWLTTSVLSFEHLCFQLALCCGQKEGRLEDYTVCGDSRVAATSCKMPGTAP